jgi:hypothetical protein
MRGRLPDCIYLVFALCCEALVTDSRTAALCGPLPLSQTGRLQQQSAWKLEVAACTASSVLVTEPTVKFSERLAALAKAVEDFEFTVADAAVFVPGRRDWITLEAQTISLKLHMLRSLFHPDGNDPYAGKLPAPASHSRDAGTTRLQVALLCEPGIIKWTAGGLREYMRNLMALGGLFESEADAREACMRGPRLLCGHSWGRLVGLKAAVLAGGGSLADLRWAVQSRRSAEVVLDAGLLKYRFGCVIHCSPVLCQHRCIA